MPKITIKNLFNKSLSTNNNTSTVLSIIHENYIDWMHTCGAKGRCTTCKMIVIKGMNNLSNQSADELKYKELNMLTDNERLACQCTLSGDVLIAVPEENKMPHMQYSE